MDPRGTDMIQQIFGRHLLRHITHVLMSTAWALLTIFPETVTAETRWQENGHELTFNMEVPYPDDPESDELIRRDVREFRIYIMENTDLTLLSISGGGGLGQAGVDIAHTILEFGLDTQAFGECLSSCAHIFLAGETRTLADGAQLGFHRPFVIGEEQRSYYLANRAERGWDSSFDYVEWVYDFALTDMRELVAFMSSRGVTLDFILEAMSYGPDEMWTPDAEVLLKSGVITYVEERQDADAPLTTSENGTPPHDQP